MNPAPPNMGIIRLKTNSENIVCYNSHDTILVLIKGGAG